MPVLSETITCRRAAGTAVRKPALPGIGRDNEFMRLAIAAARRGIAAGQTPFGCCIVRRNHIVVSTYNTVWRDTDITAHAEINAIRKACRLLRTIDLSGCTLYSTCEPCPLCFSACHWARLSRVVFGARIRDARRAGFHELAVRAARLNAAAGARIELKGGVLRREAVALFWEWRALRKSRAY